MSIQSVPSRLEALVHVVDDLVGSPRVLRAEDYVLMTSPSALPTTVSDMPVAVGLGRVEKVMPASSAACTTSSTRAGS